MAKAPTAARLSKLIDRHQGNLTEMAAAFKPPITRQGVAWHLGRLGLLDAAAKARQRLGAR